MYEKGIGVGTGAVACGACRSLIEVAPSAERRVTRVTE
jgi:hypothetical protein